VRARLLDRVQAVLAEGGVRRVDRKRMQAFGESAAYELFPVCRRLIREPEDKWDGLLRDHFRKVDALRAAAAALNASPPPFDAVAKRLRLQVLRKGGGTEDLGAGLSLQLVLSDANGEISVPDDVVERWGVGRSTVLDRARDNLAAMPLSTQRDPQNGLIALVGEGAAAQVAVLARRIEVDATHGALVAFPGPDVLVAAPVRDPSAVAALVGPFAALLARHQAERPLVDGVYRWRDGRLTEKAG
jgi:hypothetical protein